MLKKLLQNKLFIILTISLFIILNFTNVFAYTYSENELYEKMMLNAKDSFKWNKAGFCLMFNSDNTYTVYAYDYTKCVFSFNSDDNLIITFTDTTRIYCYFYNENGDRSSSSNFEQSNGEFSVFKQYTSKNYLCCNLDLLDVNGNIVNPYQPVLFQITQVEQIPEMIIRMMKMIIPIGLVVLSIGLLIYVIKSVILQAT